MTLSAMPLTLADLEDSSAPAKPSVVARLRDSHHGLARLIAEGRPRVEVSSISGYDPSYISRMEADPAFQELIEHYRNVAQAEYSHVHSRMADLASDTVQEIHQRLIEKPDEFSPSQLNDIAKTMLDRVGLGPTKTINTNNLNASVTPEILARVRSAQQQRGEVQKIGQENKAITQADRGPDSRPVIDGEAVVYPEIPLTRIEGGGAEVREALREGTGE
ncbi:MAG: hypothetical protein B7Z37_03205 [Verrucomicrobia bacterium 12-59-8]|nr:MAG: hypothetical protein B7Z37_03205 [Verrucomicrobia bacterium 12-59-8]